MKNFKVKNYEYDKEKGEAIFTIIYRGEEFTGKSKCHPDDMDLGCEFIGLSYAENRALVKGLKSEIKELRIREKELSRVHKMLVSNAKKGEVSSKAILDTFQYDIWNLRTKQESLKDTISKIEAFIKEDIVNREVFFKKIRSKREKMDKDA